MSKQCGEPLILLYHTPYPKLNKSNIRSSLLVKISTPFKPAYFFTKPNGLKGGGGSNLDGQRHSSYKSKPPQPAVVYFFQAGVLFSTENAHFGPIFGHFWLSCFTRGPRKPKKQYNKVTTR